MKFWISFSYSFPGQLVHGWRSWLFHYWSVDDCGDFEDDPDHFISRGFRLCGIDIDFRDRP